MCGRRLVAVIGAVALLISIAALPAFPQDLKIGYINSGRILDESKEYDEAQKKLEKFMKGWKEQAAKKEKELRELQAELDRQRLLLSEERREEKEREIQAKYEEYRKFVNDIVSPEGKRAQKNRELSKPIYDKINTILEKIGEAEGYDFIFDAFPGTIVYSKPEYDLTDKVIEELNREGE